MKKIKIACNNLKAKLIEPDLEAKKIVSETLSYYVAGYEQTVSYKKKKWDGRSSMFDWDTNTFAVGFLRAVCGRLASKGYQPLIMTKTLPTPLGMRLKAIGKFSYSDKYDYQWKVSDELVKRGIMIAQIATGGGKSVAAGLCYARIRRPTLILTKRQPLMYQFYNNMKEFGYDPGLIGDGKLDIKADMNVAMAQTINSKLKDEGEAGEAIRDYLKTVEFIIAEEAHEISDQSYLNVVNACPNAAYRLALTATPNMKPDSEANMNLVGSFGNVGIRVSEKLLIDRGINARPIIKFAEYGYAGKMRYGSNYQKAMYEGIVHATDRNQTIIDNAVKAVNKKLPVLILIGRREHGKKLEDAFKKLKIKARFIWGETSSDLRKEALADLASGKISVLIGSNILDVGVDVPSIGLVILAGAGKAEVAFRQRIGRGLRAKAKGPNVCFILDLADEHNMHLNAHYRERLNIVMNTPGFAENLIASNKEFPWELF